MNWGTKLAIIYCSFAIMIGFMVFKSASQSIELVETNYYEQELTYQKKIDGMKNAITHDKALTISLGNQSILLNFSDEIGKPEGMIKLLKPDNQSNDFEINIKVDNNFQQIINTTKLKKGVYLLRIDWQVNNINFYKQTRINIK